VEERKRAETIARSMEERYRGVFESATEGLLVLERRGMIVEANRAACEMHGYEPEELIGHQLLELFADDASERFEEFAFRLGEKGSVTLENVHVRQDGGTFDVELRGTLLMHRGQPAMLAIITDVTDRNRAIRQRLQLSRKVLMAQEDERARVSRDLHDGLGQLLTALRFELDWMGRKSIGPESGADFGQANKLVESAAYELRGICEGLRPPLLDELGLETAVRELVDEIRSRRAIGVDLYIRVDEDERPIQAEVALITYRVLQEALHNVQRQAKATHISVSVLNAPDGLMATVQDDGQGLDAERLPEATGLGIAGMRERAALVGGTLEILSEMGVGTRVVLSIPHPPVSAEVGA
jgi:PAS domain S-box-containing protein